MPLNLISSAVILYFFKVTCNFTRPEPYTRHTFMRDKKNGIYCCQHIFVSLTVYLIAYIEDGNVNTELHQVDFLFILIIS